jgi:hypothetical protein
MGLCVATRDFSDPAIRNPSLNVNGFILVPVPNWLLRKVIATRLLQPDRQQAERRFVFGP